MVHAEILDGPLYDSKPVPQAADPIGRSWPMVAVAPQSSRMTASGVLVLDRDIALAALRLVGLLRPFPNRLRRPAEAVGNAIGDRLLDRQPIPEHVRTRARLFGGVCIGAYRRFLIVVHHLDCITIARGARGCAPLRTSVATTELMYRPICSI